MGATCTKVAAQSVIESKEISLPPLSRPLPIILEPVVSLKEKLHVEDLSFIEETIFIRDYAKAIEPIVLSKTDPVADVVYAGVILTAIYTAIILLNT